MTDPLARPALPPFVSIVVPVYNGATTIRLCLEALQRLEYPRERYEVIVVDNNSTDGTPAIVSQYPVRLVYERALQGPHAATNTGVREARGDVLAFTDADCIPEPSWLTALVAPFADDEVVATGGRIEAYQPTSRVERFLSEMQPFRNCVRLSESFPAAIITGNAAYRANAFRAAGLFDPHMPTGAEVDLAWRIQLSTGKRAVYVPHAVVRHKFDPSVRRLFGQFHRYGYSEVLLGTAYRDLPDYPRPPRAQVRQLLRQGGSLFTYLASLLYRSLRALWHGSDGGDVASPALWLVVESGSMCGKLRGLWATRFYRRRFWSMQATHPPRPTRRCT